MYLLTKYSSASIVKNYLKYSYTSPYNLLHSKCAYISFKILIIESNQLYLPILYFFNNTNIILQLRKKDFLENT